MVKTIDHKTKCPWCLKEYYLELEDNWKTVIATCPHCDKQAQLGNWKIDRVDFKTPRETEKN